MGYNAENYKKIREKYRTKYLDAYAKADRRANELHAKCPELAVLDRALSRTGVEIALAALGTGENAATNIAAVRKRNEKLQEERAALLQKMGYPVDYTLPPYECPKCKDSGYVGTQMCDCMRKELVLAGLASSGLGALLDKQSFENFSLGNYGPTDRPIMEKNLQIVKDFAAGYPDKGRNLLFVGGTGLGKTHVSTAIAKVVVERGFDVYYTTAADMIKDFEAARFGRQNAENNDNPARYLECDLLILDDLGTEFQGQTAVSAVYTVLNERINAGLGTIVNTNLSQKELQARYTDRVVSRLLGEYQILLFRGEDVRMKRLNRN